MPCGPAATRVRSLRWLRRCQGCRMEGINVPTCPAQLLPPLEDGSYSADRNPTGPWGLHHFIPTRSDLTNSTFQSVCIRGSCPKCWSFSKFSLCNQSSSLKLPVNPFSSLSPPQQSWFLWVSPEGVLSTVLLLGCTWMCRGSPKAALAESWSKTLTTSPSIPHSHLWAELHGWGKLPFPSSS